MDYIDYELNKHYNEIAVAEEMQRQGFETSDEYFNHLEDLKAEAEISYFESKQNR